MSRNKMHIRRGDIVKAISGEDADGKKTGKVLRVYPAQNRALVEGFNFVTKHLRKSQDHPNGAIVQREAPMAASKLKVVTPAKKAEKD
ncbi:MAG: 50S ribosomal protein L24 [Lentisphaerae bacterium]|jgi:large subunit ribosomal protein L24|nr:50S ribosomal protein L24 [Lentisphaerota bacterium]